MNVEEIKANTSMKDLLSRYGIDVRHGRCKCFVHNGKNTNMSIYKDKIVHCFKCGAKLDVFGVVQALENCTFKEAMSKLGGDAPATPKMKLAARKAIIKQTQLEVAEKRYDKALREWCACDYIRSYYRQTKDQSVYPHYVFAMQNISFYEQKLNECEVNLFELRNKR